MNYENIYYSIINNAKFQNRTKNINVYFEEHRIKPKSFGGVNDKENLVLLINRKRAQLA